jgi:hypothetical protein
MSANITVVPAMPNASVNAAVPVNVFARQRLRYARRRSWLRASSIAVTQVASTATGGPTLVVSQSTPHFRRCTSSRHGWQDRPAGQCRRLVLGCTASCLRSHVQQPAVRSLDRMIEDNWKRRKAAGSSTPLRHMNPGRLIAWRWPRVMSWCLVVGGVETERARRTNDECANSRKRRLFKTAQTPRSFQRDNYR